MFQKDIKIVNIEMDLPYFKFPNFYDDDGKYYPLLMAYIYNVW